MSQKRQTPFSNKENNSATFIVYTDKPPSPKKRRKWPTIDEIKEEQARVGPLLQARQAELENARKSNEEQQRRLKMKQDEERIAAERHRKMSEVLKVLNEMKMTVPEFLDIFWNSKDQQHAATVSRHLARHGSRILDTIMLKREDIAKAWVQDQVKEIITAEAKLLSNLLRRSSACSLSEAVSTFSISNIIDEARNMAPMLWSALEWAGSRDEGIETTRRDRNLVRTFILCRVCVSVNGRLRSMPLSPACWLKHAASARTDCSLSCHSGCLRVVLHKLNLMFSIMQGFAAHTRKQLPTSTRSQPKVWITFARLQSSLHSHWYGTISILHSVLPNNVEIQRAHLRVVQWPPLSSYMGLPKQTYPSGLAHGDIVPT
jgi:hypothetical protein